MSGWPFRCCPKGYVCRIPWTEWIITDPFYQCQHLRRLNYVSLHSRYEDCLKNLYISPLDPPRSNHRQHPTLALSLHFLRPWLKTCRLTTQPMPLLLSLELPIWSASMWTRGRINNQVIAAIVCLARIESYHWQTTERGLCRWIDRVWYIWKG